MGSPGYTAESIYLLAGEIRISEKQESVWTVLGSCVSIILRHVNSGYSIICHAQLPEESTEGGKCAETCPSPCYMVRPSEVPGQYVTCALRFMEHTLKKKGFKTEEIEASLFGGSALLKGFSDYTRIGAKNTETAKNLLKQFGIRLVREDTGGEVGRTIYLDTSTGSVTVKMQMSQPDKKDLDALLVNANSSFKKINDLLEKSRG